MKLLEVAAMYDRFLIGFVVGFRLLIGAGMSAFGADAAAGADLRQLLARLLEMAVAAPQRGERLCCVPVEFRRRRLRAAALPLPTATTTTSQTCARARARGGVLEVELHP